MAHLEIKRKTMEWGEEESGMDLVSIFFSSSVWLGVVWKHQVVHGWDG